MKISYAGQMITISTSSGKYRILPKADFERLVVKPGLSRKKAAKIGIGSKLFNNTLKYYYSESEIEASRVDKIKNANNLERFNTWKDNLDRLEPIVPGITKLFRDNLKNNPELIELKLQELNEWFYEIKDFIKTTKKYIRQSVNRNGGKPLKLVANLSEYKVRRILIELGYEVENQFYIKPYWYDFRVGNYLIEYDGQNHTDVRDKAKNQLAKKHGYTIIRIGHNELDFPQELKNKLKHSIKCSPHQR
jgi:very-short-patch-repair endonuclease